MTQYESWKSGDPLVGGTDPQKIKPKTWTLMEFGKNGTVITPVVDGIAYWGTYVNVQDNSDAKTIMVRFIRDPKKLADFTGAISYTFAAGHIFSHLWMFKAKKGQPVGVQVWHDGSKPIILGTREFKAAIG